MMFMVKAAQLGFATAKPYRDSRKYDFIVDTERRLWRVQVKSSNAKQLWIVPGELAEER
jgi:hypothetical protein